MRTSALHMGETMARPPRLPVVFQEYNPPLYFVTFCTLERRACLNIKAVHEAFVKYASAGIQKGAGVGRYVIMPDHVHVFVRGSPGFVLGVWVKGLKRAVGSSVILPVGHGLWQAGYFDHLIRHSESYAEKWQYVRENPVRKGLVAQAGDWPFQGEIVRIESV